MIRRELLIAFCFLILSVVAFLPLLLVALGNYEGTALQKAESLLSDRQELLIALGTLFLVLGLSVWAGHLANRSAEHREKYNRRTQAEIKIAEFRQLWINELREDVASLISISSEKIKEDEISEYHRLWTKIELRLNPGDTEHVALVEELGALTEAIFRRSGVAKAQTSIQTRVSFLLKAEWDRLKKDLKTAQDDGSEQQ